MLESGKVPYGIMKNIIKKINKNNKDPRVVIGPKMGQDVAVLDMGDTYIVTKTDPITFTTKDIGYYVVNINANDIATAGATPKWFQATVLLPAKVSKKEDCEEILMKISEECKRLGISYVGGHTEITHGINRPLVIGFMLGEVKKKDLVTTMDGKPGDAIILTKGIVLEGIAIIASEKEEFLKTHGFSTKEISKFKKYLYDPGISVLRDAKLLSNNFNIHAMHDPTEGGLANGVVELARNSECGVLLEQDKIPLLEGTKEICNLFDLNPLGTITSGCLIAAVEPKELDPILDFMHKKGIVASKIGNLTDQVKNYEIINQQGEKAPLEHSDIDEITKIF